MKKILSLLLCGIITFCAAPLESTHAAATFKDVPSTHWAYENINKMVDADLLKGYPDGTFRPSGAISVGEYLKLITLCITSDITQGEGASWAYPYLDFLCKEGITSEQVFPKNQLSRGITRAEMAELIENVILYLDLKLSEDYFTDVLAKAWTYNPIDFTDTPDSTLHVWTAAQVAARYGILNGYYDGSSWGEKYYSFRPYNTLTRAEACASISRLKWYKPDTAEIVDYVYDNYLSETAMEQNGYTILDLNASKGLAEYKSFLNKEISNDTWANMDLYSFEEIDRAFPEYKKYAFLFSPEVFEETAEKEGYYVANQNIKVLDSIINLVCKYRLSKSNYIVTEALQYGSRFMTVYPFISADEKLIIFANY